MSCGCVKVDKTPLWTAIPPYRQPTDIQPGENIECYAKRSGSVSGEMNDNGPKPENKIDNTSFTSDLDLHVNTTFKLTPESTKTPTIWKITVDGVNFTSKFPELTVTNLSSSTFNVSGTVSDTNANKSYNVLVEADDSDFIDSRSFTFFPKKADKDDAIKFVIPLVSSSGVHVTSPYGPRKSPAPGASTFHRGLDFAAIDHGQGTIVSTADGIVVKAGPMSGFGNGIIIEHNDAQGRLVASSVYGHMNDGNLFVKAGDKVAAGQKIALEGNNGIGSAMHLHFEIHKGKWAQGAGVDPTPYLNGVLPIANNTGNPASDGSATPTTSTTQTNTNAGMTTPEASSPSNCPKQIPNKPDGGTAPANSSDATIAIQPSTPVAVGKNKNRSICSSDEPLNTGSVQDTIEQTCADAGLNTEETSFIVKIAKIESGLDPYAKNPTSSATGLFQMLDSIAVKYYEVLGVPPTCANRCDPAKATQAMIEFFKREFKPYYNGWVNSGHTTIAGKKIQQTSWGSQYSGSAVDTAFWDMGTFMYGLLHHDGVGNAVSGVDKQGVAYWKSKA